jgi:stress response protein YsnF
MDWRDEPTVRWSGETIGHVEGAPDAGGLVPVRLSGGTLLMVPSEWLRPGSDGYDAARDLRRLPRPERGPVVPLAAERLRVAHRRLTGRVTVRVRPVTHRETVTVPVRVDRVEVKHVPVDRMVDEAPPVRQEGDVTIVPVLEEVLVVERRLRVREEIHIRRIHTVRRETRTVALRREIAEIRRTPGPAEGTSGH